MLFAQHFENSGVASGPTVAEPSRTKTCAVSCESMAGTLVKESPKKKDLETEGMYVYTMYIYLSIRKVLIIYNKCAYV